MNKSQWKRVFAAGMIMIALASQGAYAQATLIDLEREHAAEMIRKQNTVRIMVVGDIMMHMPIVNSAERDETHAFEEIFAEVKGYFSTADLVIGNLETTLTDHSGEYSGYPRFKSPVELAGDLKTSGFDILTTANNHAYDNGEEGLERTILALEAAGLMHTGTFVDENRNGLVVDLKNVRIGLLASTYGTNGLVPNHPYQVNYNDMETIRRDYEWLVTQGTDLQMIMIHWGTEYRDYPSANQIEFQRQLKDIGFDIVLGSHPHVIQPVIREDLYFSIYSMGNFLSNQRDGFKDLGLIVDLVIERSGKGVIIRRAEMIPTWVDKYHAGLPDYRIVRLDDEKKRIEPSEMNHIKQLSRHFDEIMSINLDK